MSDVTSYSELIRLPKPEMIHDLDYESTLLERKALLNSLQPLLFNDKRKPVFKKAELFKDEQGEFFFKIPASEDIGLLWLDLESEPTNKLLQEATYREMVQGQRINDSLAANLLALAIGANLDHHVASFYDVYRLEGETDDALRQRTQLSIRGWSPGTDDYYEFQARSAINGIKDVMVDTPSDTGIIRITVMAEEGDGYPSTEIIDAVRERVNQKGIKLNNDTLIVEAVELVGIELIITLYMYDQSMPENIISLKESFSLLFNSTRGLGWDLAKSWVDSNHHVVGVKRVACNLPENTIIEPNQSPFLLSYDVVNGGNEW